MVTRPRVDVHALRWLVDEWQWPYAGAVAACFLLTLVPVIWSTEGLALALIFAQLPLYMLHQVEEHGQDRFRRWVNERFSANREALTRPLTFAINLIGVWVLLLAAFLLSYYVSPGLGLIAVYTTALNALVHVVVAIARREYNPGLVTAVALFAPVATWAVIEANSRYEVSAGQQALAIGVAVAGHLVIIAIVAARLRAEDA